jgi:hypothetical protein
VAIGIAKALVYRDLSGLIPILLNDLEAVLVQVVHEHFELFVLNIYMNYYQRKHRLLAPPSHHGWRISYRENRVPSSLCAEISTA